jgi:hypothetical protein
VDRLPTQLPANVGVLPQGTLMNDQRFQPVLRVVPYDQVSPQGQLLLPRGEDRLDGKKGREGVKFWVLVDDAKKCPTIRR